MPSTPFEVILLGSGAAFPPLSRENCSLVLSWEGGIWLIDCGASPFRRLRLAGLDPDDLCGVLITHAHPDHLYGLPSLIHCLIPASLRGVLPILAPPETLECARRILQAFKLMERPEVELELKVIPVDGDPATPLSVHEMNGMTLWAAPVAHTLEAVGVRAEVGGRVMAYSGDTAPCKGVSGLAQGAHLLVHEATFRESDRDVIAPGHSTARDAGMAAAEGGVERLVMVHFLEETLEDPEALRMEALRVFDGNVDLGKDLERYSV